MSVGQALVTAEEFEQIAAESTVQLELVRGEIVEMTRPGVKHGGVCAAVVVVLSNWAQAEKRGRVIANDAGIQTEQDPDSIRGPDVFYIRMDRLPDGKYPEGWLTIPPDLCVEVLSPNDRWGEVVTRIDEYLTLGVPEVWVLDPSKREVQVHVADGESLTVLKEGDSLTSERLPGFQCPVNELFEGC